MVIYSWYLIQIYSKLDSWWDGYKDGWEQAHGELPSRPPWKANRPVNTQPRPDYECTYRYSLQAAVAIETNARWLLRSDLPIGPPSRSGEGKGSPGYTAVDPRTCRQFPTERTHRWTASTQGEKVIDSHIRLVLCFKNYRSIIRQI